MHEFWGASQFNAKSKLVSKYQWLTYHHYRNNLNYEQLQLFQKDVGDIVPQAYLALRGLENKENTFTFARSCVHLSVCISKIIEDGKMVFLENFFQRIRQ